jgi:hypothetical protein
MRLNPYDRLRNNFAKYVESQRTKRDFVAMLLPAVEEK